MTEDAKRTAASVRLFTHEKSVDFITEALGFPPTKFHLAGDVVSSRIPGLTRTDSLWSLQSNLADTEDLDAHLSHLRVFLSSCQEALQAIQPRLLMGDVFCMFSSGNGQGSCVVSCENLATLAACGLELVIDLYPPPKADVPTKFCALKRIVGRVGVKPLGDHWLGRPCRKRIMIG